MPRVPQYGDQKVNLVGLPNVQAARSRYNIAGVYSDITQQVSGFVGANAREIQARQAKEQEEADIFRVEQQINKLHEAESGLTHGENGALTLKGENVFSLGEPLTSVYQKRYDDAANNLSAELGNDNQRRRFAIVAGRLRQQFTGRLQSHEAGETRALRESTFKGVVASESEAVARALDDPNPETRTEAIGFSIGRVRANADRYYQKELGLTKELANAEVLKLESMMHKIVVDRYLEQNNPIDAKAYFEANKDRINDKDATTARKQIEKDGRDFLVNKAADDIWARMGPKGDNDPVNLDLMEREASKAFEKDADGRKLLISELRQKQQAHDYSAKERNNATIGGIWKQVMAGAPLASIRRSNEFRTLDGRSQAVMIDQIEAFQKPPGMTPEAREAKNAQEFGEYWGIVSQPDRLAGMSDAAILAMTPRLGLSNVQQLLKAKMELTKPDKVIAVNMQMDTLKSLATEAGMNINSAKTKEDLGRIHLKAETIINSEQQRLKRPLGFEEKNAIVKQLVAEVPVTVKGRLWGTTTETRRVFEVQYPENIVIPANEKTIITDALKKAGIQNPTAAQIREGYIRLKMK